MSNRNFLLTYDIAGKGNYAWLESEKEMNEMIDELNANHENVVIHDKLELCQVREIE
jgi:hypothetical protein